MLDFFKFNNLLKYFYFFSKIIFIIFISLFLIGFFLGLFIIPLDFQQGEMYKLIYLHVPAAWLSLIIYTFIVIFSILFLILKSDIFFIISQILSKYGIIFCFMTLLTGSFWGKPLWGAFWVWDARLTSMLILFFIYVGHYLLINLLNKQNNYKDLTSIFAIFGFIFLPIIKYSVEWWTTLHQNASLNFSQNSFVHSSVYFSLFFIFLSLISLIFLFIFLELKIKYIENQLRIE